MRLVVVFFLFFSFFSSSLFSQSDIVGGENADIQDYPYQAALLYSSGGWSYAYCGASIINEYWILTAAHCVEGESASNTVVRVGSDDLYAQGGSSYDADEIIIHNNYNSNTMNNDIALIKLANPIIFNNSRQSVLLMCDNQVDLGIQDAGQTSWITGWGDTEGTTNSSQLQVVAVPITTESDYGWGQIDSDMIMAGYEDGGYDSCQGDSGGPMVVLAADGETYLQCGIVSWGYGCADPGYPGVYTRVSYFVDWICNNTDGEVCANASDLCANNTVYGCIDITANNYNLEATIDDGSCEYECDQDVSLLITFDCWPEETGWSIVNGNGSVIASQNTGFYSDSEVLETICLSEGCYTFTINDSYGDGMGGSQWSSCGINGSYQITLGSEILINGEGDFGYSNSHEFCIISPVYGCTDINACNYWYAATENDNSCIYPEEGYDCDGNCLETYTVIIDCLCSEYETLLTWNEFNEESCTIFEYCACECFNDINGNGICDEDESGCTDFTSCNYDSYALINDGSCIYALDNYDCDGNCLMTIDCNGDCGGLAEDLGCGCGNPGAEEGYDCNGYLLSSVQEIALSEGWGIWSTYIDVNNVNIASIFSEIASSIVIVKDQNGDVYWPQYNLNSIGSLQNGSAYQIKMSNNENLIMSGELVSSDFYIPLNGGWSLLGYLNLDCNNTENMMSSIVNDLVIMKDENGNVYWPEFGLNSIGNMCPGKGYQIKMNNAVFFNYPSGGRFDFHLPNMNNPIYYTAICNTGNNMTIGLPIPAWKVLPGIGDEIAAYNESGKLIGSSVFLGNHLSLTVWGDDLTTETKDGLLIGESIIFNLWSSQTNTISELIINKWELGDNLYAIDGISIASSITLQHKSFDKELLKTIDILGRETNKKGFNLDIYTDGSVEKKYVK